MSDLLLLDGQETEDLDLGYGEDIYDYGEDIDDYGEDIDDYGEDSEDYGEDSEDYGEEDYYDGESDSAESRRSRWLRGRARARRLALMRRRALARARARRSRRRVPSRRTKYFPSRPSPRRSAPVQKVAKGFQRVGADIKKTKAAINTVNLENKVQGDTFGRLLKAQQSRIGRTEYSLAANKVVDELKVQFPDLISDSILKTALPLVPLLFLTPHKRGSGFESMISDPRVLGVGITALIALYKNTSKSIDQPPKEIKISDKGTLGVNEQRLLEVEVKDVNGKEINYNALLYTSSNTDVVLIDPKTGVMQAVGNKTETATITVIDQQNRRVESNTKIVLQ